ncbi:hypothetical protein EGR_11234 [Echinococcus granulosus]|uniref:Uncharacterized protein n=1 Tax=Echinococcus granulosus TaxID=6210 RepID=W6UK68_ECHGR|nr:hypothetical protein EGR_11234 [Echinococcus granulosus]EUB53909.1 hypothetical protein EGR_11234 [Echinococcus granulosus]
MSISMQVIGLFPPPPSFSANYLSVFKDEMIATNMPNVIPMKTASEGVRLHISHHSKPYLRIIVV